MNVMETYESDPDKEVISDEERQLASELRSLCSSSGIESKVNLPQCADVLLQMGKLYLRKTRSTSGMLQKLTFIRSSALLHAAKLRFKMLDLFDELHETNDALLEFQNRLYQAFNITSFEDLNGISDEILQQLQDLREHHKKELDEIPGVEREYRNEDAAWDIPVEEALRMGWNEMRKLMNKDVYGAGQHITNEMLEAKINAVKEMMKQLTADYKELMSKIADKCVSLLGQPPCKFSGVGLGSLAREEITLYSDFEHVIVLENDVDSCKNYADIQQYFRKFAMLFQIIIIGFGETVIPSIRVRSLNDTCAEGKSMNWYFDNYSPPGVAFDGMVPHACNNPLGRPYKTKKRQHKLEFIQPVKKMAKFLSSDEEVKNGYYIKDVLARTCYVFGDMDVNEQFVLESRTVLNSENQTNVVKEQVQKIEENFNRYVGDEVLTPRTQLVNIKVKTYRPLTALLGYMARMYGISQPSSFGIIDKMAGKKYITEHERKELEYATAVACELRMKTYAHHRHQRHKMSMDRLIDFVGKESLVKSIETIGWLRQAAKDIAEAWSSEGGESNEMESLVVLPEDRRFFRLHALFQLGFYMDALVMGNRVMVGSKKTFAELLRALAYAKLPDYRFRAIQFSEQGPEDSFTNLLNRKDLPKWIREKCYEGLCTSQLKNGSYSLCEATMQEWQRNASQSDLQHHRNFQQIAISLKFLTLDNSEFISFANAALMEEKVQWARFFLRLKIIEAEKSESCLQKTETDLSALVADLASNADETSKDCDFFIDALDQITELQIHHHWNENALATIQVMKEIWATNKSEHYSYCDEREAKMLFRIGEYATCIDHIETLQSKGHIQTAEKLLIYQVAAEAAQEDYSDPKTSKIGFSLLLSTRSTDGELRSQLIKMLRCAWTQSFLDMNIIGFMLASLFLLIESARLLFRTSLPRIFGNGILSLLLCFALVFFCTSFTFAVLLKPFSVLTLCVLYHLSCGVTDGSTHDVPENLWPGYFLFFVETLILVALACAMVKSFTGEYNIQQPHRRTIYKYMYAAFRQLWFDARD